MGQKNFLLHLCVCSLLSYAPFFSFDTHAYNNLEVAQGDGEPVEVSVEEQLQAAQKLADEENENTATITAEGDFLLPTYLLKTTEDDSSEVKETFVDEPLFDSPIEKQDNSVKKVTTVKKKTQTDLPVVMIKQTELIPVNEQMEVERKLTGSTAQTQKIYNQATKKKSSVLTNEKRNNLSVPAKKQADTSIASSTSDEISSILEGTDTLKTPEVETGKKKPLLLPLKGTKKPVKAESVDEFIPNPRLKTYSSVYADKVLEAAQTNQELPLIMPMDLKVSFYPNAADFSGQTIKWLKVFSLKALQDPRYVIEVRLSKENLLLQQKRLFVIQKILANSGLSSHQLVVDYVKRPKDSLILRMVKKESSLNVRSSSKKEKGVINW